MRLEIGSICEGRITGITQFGAFVDLGEGMSGMVHISEVAPTFVRNIRDFVTEGQPVTVKVIDMSPDGKIALSIKQALPPEERVPRSPRGGRMGGPGGPRNSQPRDSRRGGPQSGHDRRERGAQSGDRRSSGGHQSQGRPGDFEWQPRGQQGGSFEDMMSKFKQQSDEKISDLKRGNNEVRRPRRSGGEGGPGRR